MANVMSLMSVEQNGPLSSAEGASVWVREVDCSKYSSQTTSPECEERREIGLGIFVVVAVLVLAVGYVVWRLMMRKIDEKRPNSQPDGSS